MKDKIKIYAIIILFMMLLAIGFTMYVSKKNQCIDNPFTYAAKIVSEKAESDVTCNCYFDNPTYENFYFNKEKVEVGSSFISFIEE